jgi:hypothetical protein
MKHITKSFKPVPKINYARFKFTLILLALLSLGYYVKADDTSCHNAIEVQQATIDSLQSQLATVKSVPYNQGYQAGYKAAKATSFNAHDVGTMIVVITFCIIFLAITTTIIIQSVKD